MKSFFDEKFFKDGLGSQLDESNDLVVYIKEMNKEITDNIKKIKSTHEKISLSRIQKGIIGGMSVKKCDFFYKGLRDKLGEFDKKVNSFENKMRPTISSDQLKHLNRIKNCIEDTWISTENIIGKIEHYRKKNNYTELENALKNIEEQWKSYHTIIKKESLSLSEEIKEEQQIINILKKEKIFKKIEKIDKGLKNVESKCKGVKSDILVYEITKKEIEELCYYSRFIKSVSNKRFGIIFRKRWWRKYPQFSVDPGIEIEGYGHPLHVNGELNVYGKKKKIHFILAA